MNTLYKSTRGGESDIQASLAIIKGLACDGGLFVPNEIPKLDKPLEDLLGLEYKDLAYEIMKLYLTDFTEEELRYCINNAYDDKFDTEEIAPVVKKNRAHYLELFHGSTIAFKDMALSILPYLMKVSAKKQNIDKEIVILTATSGDTGKAALAGFADVEGIKIIVFYPKDGVSPIQKQQMVTQKGDNTYVVGIEGNFDDAQNGVKEIFNNDEFVQLMDNNGYRFSSANSINIGRLIPQIVYYFYAYTKMVASGDIKMGEDINVVVPTGNFGNILAAYYAKNMGLPIHQLICASNDNKVLYDFMNTGVYNRKREFVLTISPSMDILISSNLERLLYKISDNKESVINDLMSSLSSKGEYEISEDMKKGLKDFYGNYASIDETYDAIKEVFDKSGYLIDSHTAVGSSVYKKYKKDTGDNRKTVIASTASPYKFTRSVMKAIDESYEKYDDFELIKKMNELTGVDVPEAIKDIIGAEIRHKMICDKDKMKETVKEILSLS
ncbi:threonine synthase [Vallitalea guaymasensis]|uniref:Threonine synthase n=1 Tax=Vallitalea guaymasensis TaxID=1185412 RepID=A0A8J8SAP8_9FIRM|nr:threonine synthase [Vallitalea guaymasensis]QUH27506.1 threonine synthase [Vallitalea guaymasensis]